ncbi:MAG: 1-(5-phosphoribosyl)-5-[(5-phosphoribosylamino)methylideneamino]imidazole-4-carboxamide isomerase [Lachnospiraceae bacterium]|jgi:phosphoribosylformimino-5-aminoimidazole carboxamide ribotide isomerase|nr:1-(5-phosphoribosyl)-5-[(5-phosphoribosylamino)methylideneamino]imidazole-4-carboxamide isomerase [Lachnospiraceae bacterium]
MHLYPAIDLKGGRCVRLFQGDFGRMTVYADDPAQMAATWLEQGAGRLHVVDLDGALAGRGANRQAIADILAVAGAVPVQVGGGIREDADIEELLSMGVSRVIIGTKAVEEPEFVRRMVDRHGGGRIVAGIDARDGFVATKGWGSTSRLTPLSVCRTMGYCGVRTVVYTDILRDGGLAGPNVASTKELMVLTGLEVIASGGVSSMEDLQALSDAGIQGAIVGKALYEGRISLQEAVGRFEM